MCVVSQISGKAQVAQEPYQSDGLKAGSAAVKVSDHRASLFLLVVRVGEDSLLPWNPDCELRRKRETRLCWPTGAHYVCEGEGVQVGTRTLPEGQVPSRISSSQGRGLTGWWGGRGKATQHAQVAMFARMVHQSSSGLYSAPAYPHSFHTHPQHSGHAHVHCTLLHVTHCYSSQVLQSHTPDASQLALRGWSIEAALASSTLSQRPVSLGDVERRLAVADPALWQEYQVCVCVGGGGWGGKEEGRGGRV